MNWKSLTYKQRNAYLLAGTVLFMIVAYVFAIRKTISLYRENQKLQNSVDRGEDVQHQLGRMENKLTDLSNYLNAYALDSLKDQQYIMSQVSELCKTYDVTLKSFPGAVVSSEKDFGIETNVIETEGRFINQLKLIHALETEKKAGRISGVSFRAYPDNRTKKLTLSLTIYLQNIKTH